MEGQKKAKTLTAVRLNPKQLQQIEQWAEEEVRPTGEMIRVLLDEALAARKAKGE